MRWYFRYKLSYRDLVEMMADRGLPMSHTTIMRWVQQYIAQFDKCWNRNLRQGGQSWRLDQTYVKTRGRWVYLCHAVDRDAHSIHFRLSPKRDMAAAKALFCIALKTLGACAKQYHARRLRRIASSGA